MVDLTAAETRHVARALRCGLAACGVTVAVLQSGEVRVCS